MKNSIKIIMLALCIFMAFASISSAFAQDPPPPPGGGHGGGGAQPPGGGAPIGEGIFIFRCLPPDTEPKGFLMPEKGWRNNQQFCYVKKPGLATAIPYENNQ